MIEAASDTDVLHSTDSLPYLSHSRLSRYLHCPEQYRLYYIERLRPRIQSANLVFGQVIHQSLATLFSSGEDPIDVFKALWSEAEDTELSYSRYDTWEKLREVGEKLLELFVREEAAKIGKIRAIEQEFQFRIVGLPIPFIGIIDLVAEVEGVLTVVDFKTSSSAYGSHEAVLSDQLVTYQLVEPGCRQTAFCALIKTKTPTISWLYAQPDATRVVGMLSKIAYVAGGMLDEHFYRRQGKWCSWCDYLPICCEDQWKAEETLVQLE